MKIVLPGILQPITINSNSLSTVVIENPDLLYNILLDLKTQVFGGSGQSVLSQENVPVSFSKYAEVLDGFAPFELNRKSLLTKVMGALEHKCQDTENYMRGNQLLGEIETYMEDLSFDLPCVLSYQKLNWNSLIKAAGLYIESETTLLAEQIIEYMDLVSNLENEKLFILVNLRSFVDDKSLELFASTCMQHGFHVLMIDSVAKDLLTLERRLTIDYDLCEF